ncbi:MAG: hypothetical protein OEV87_08215 [Phycisphaerae bacterium]|jgi:hypothetical protein|nr:hypothetical protein [Phycisphaerae bacterium]
MNTTKDFWKHIENGRIYAIKCSCFGEILGACGPLDPDNLPDLDAVEWGKDTLIWVETTMAENKLRRFNPEPVKNQAKSPLMTK